MGLISSYYNRQFDLTITDCYWKIEPIDGIIGGKENLRVRISCYKNKDVADSSNNIYKYSDFIFQFVPDLNSTYNFIAQAYIFAKSLPEFSDAVDA
jgi:hypothetical protein